MYELSGKSSLDVRWYLSVLYVLSVLCVLVVLVFLSVLMTMMSMKTLMAMTTMTTMTTMIIMAMAPWWPINHDDHGDHGNHDDHDDHDDHRVCKEVQKQVGGCLVLYNLQPACVRKLEVIWPNARLLPLRIMNYESLLNDLLSEWLIYIYYILLTFI